MKNLIDNINQWNEGMYMKKLVFARSFLPIETICEAYLLCSQLQYALADSQTEICKKIQFLST